MLSLKIRRRRDRFTIVRDILQAMANKGVMRMTHLMYQSNLNPRVLLKYIDVLQKKGYIKVKHGDAVNRKNIEITDKGVEFLTALQQYLDLRERFIISHYSIVNSLFSWGGTLDDWS
jgi:Predicted transcriptional regulator